MAPHLRAACRCYLHTWLLEKIFIQESTTKKLSIKKNWNHSPDLLHMEQSWDEIACILKCLCCCLKCLIIYNLIFFFQNYIHMFLFNWFNVQRISPFYNIFVTEIVNDNLSYDTLPGLFKDRLLCAPSRTLALLSLCWFSFLLLWRDLGITVGVFSNVAILMIVVTTFACV